jgi:two-component system, NarL family, nitrate/nitrite response regulator NarL
MYSLVICGPAIYRSAISDLLRTHRGELRVASQSNHVPDARRLLVDVLPDAALVISSLDSESALAEIKQLRRIDLDVRLIWWSLNGDGNNLKDSVADMAIVVSWESDAEQIVEALGIPVPKPAPRSVPKLTSQEQLILQLAAEGMSNRAIAFRLAISESTVKNHLRHIGAKFNTSSRAQAVWQAVQWGYLVPSNRISDHVAS